MKQFLVAGVLAAAMAIVPAVAQEQGQDQKQDQQQQRREQFQQRMAEYKDRLKLAPEQEERLTGLIKDQMQKARDIRAKYQEQANPDRRAMMQEMRGLQEDLDGKVAEFLSKDQMIEWNKIREENQQRMRDNMRRRKQQ